MNIITSKIISAVFEELSGRSGRSGIGDELSHLDSDTMGELRLTLANQINCIIGGTDDTGEKWTKGVVRYARPKIITGSAGEDFSVTGLKVVDDNLGGITFIFNINHTAQVLEVGYSICKDDENFDKTVGRQIAQKMLDDNHPGVLRIQYDSKVSLVSNVLTAIWGAMSGSNAKLLNGVDDRNFRTRLFFLNDALRRMEILQ